MPTTSATGRQSSPPVGCRGLTLIELILVMALALMVMALAAPRLDAFSRRSVLRSQADAVLAMLRAARDRSAAEGNAYRLAVDGRAGQCTLLWWQEGVLVPVDRPGPPPLELPAGVRIELTRLDGQVGEAWIDVQPTGAVTPARITLRDGRGHVMVLVARTPLEPFRVREADGEDPP